MSTITKELAKLFRKITNSEIDAEGNAHVVLSPADSILINNARIALASLEAEPVAWLLSGGGAKNHVSFDSSNAYADPLREVTPLYAAPQLPQPAVVSDEMIDTFEAEFRRAFEVSPEVEQMLEIGYQGEKFSFSIRDAATWWKLGRAAILQAGNHTEQHLDMVDHSGDANKMVAGNSPVIPDGWIKCSERMPEDEQEVLTRNRMGHCFVSFFDEHSGLFFDRVDVAAACCIEHILVTHWMPLPAAPQQEE